MNPTLKLKITAWITLLLVSGYHLVAAQSIPFDHSIIDNNGPESPWAKIVGDIDGDGFTDIIIGGRKGPLVWYKFPLWSKSVIVDGGYDTVDGEAVDIDGDGDPDIVMGGLIWYENPLPGRSPASGKWKAHTIADHPTHDVEVGDLDNDGDQDIVIRDQSEFGHKAGNKMYVWWQENSQSWAEQVIDCPHGEGITLADMNDDGYSDIVTGGIWYENTQTGKDGQWKAHTFATFHSSATVKTADVNGDGRLDVVLTPSELKDDYYKISWFEKPPDPEKGNWTEHTIENNVECIVHSLETADMNSDGRCDIITAEMHQGADPDEVCVYINIDNGVSWEKQVLSAKGSHFLRIADFGNDGDIDIIGANHGGDYQPIELWDNKLNDPLSGLDSWTYIEVDNARQKWGDWNEPEYMKYFGLSMADVTGDNYKDIVSGRYFYRNPAGNMTGAWKRTDLGFNVDGMLFVDVDGDKFGDVIAEALPDVYWLEANDTSGESWTATKICSIPKTGHINGQGYTLAQILPGGKPEVLLSSGEGIFCIEIPTCSATAQWRTTKIAPQATEEGIGTGDIDGDGDIDIAAGSGEKKGDGMTVSWWENPGDGSSDWKILRVGETVRFADRFEIADMNDDGRADIVVTEERWPEPEDAHVWWFEQTGDVVNPEWQRHIVATQNTSNNLDVADIDRDGDYDIITSEHRGTKKLKIFENNGTGDGWKEHIIATGKEGHLGARVADMDNDGDLDILSIAWDDYMYLHLWRNDNK